MWLLGMTPGWSQSAMPVDDAFSSQSPHEYLWFYEDKAQEFDFRTIESAAFQQDARHKLNWGIVPTPVWLKILIKDSRQSQEPLVLVFDYPLLDEVSYVVCSGDQPVFKMCSDVREVGRMRPQERHRQTAASDELLISQPRGLPEVRYHTVWIKVQQTAGSLQLTSKILTQSEHLRSQRQQVMVSGLYYGGLFVLIVYNFFVCLSLRSWKYVFYVTYMSAYLCFQLFASGYGYGMLGNLINPWVSGKIIPTSILMFGHSSLIFAVLFLNIKASSKFTFWSSIIFITIGQLTIMVSPWLGNQLFYRIVVSIITPIWVVLEFTCGLVALRSPQYRRAAILYLLSWSAFVTGSFVIMLRIIGVLPIHFLTMYAMQIGSWMEGVLMSFAMGDVINQLRFQTARQASSLAQTNDQLKKAESQLRNELKTRNMLVSNLSHRTNNPLNYIAVSAQVMVELLSEQRGMLRTLLGGTDGEADEDNRRLLSRFESQFQELDQAIAQVNLGLNHSIQSIADIRNISGVDGFSMQDFTLSELLAKLRERCKAATGTSLTQVELISEGGHDFHVVGNVVLLSLILEMILLSVLKSQQSPQVSFRMLGSPDGNLALHIHSNEVHFASSLSLGEEADYIRYMLESSAIQYSFPHEDELVLKLGRREEQATIAA